MLDKILQFLARMMGNVVQDDTLWTNPNPASEFSDGKLKFNTKGYDYIGILYGSDSDVQSYVKLKNIEGKRQKLASTSNTLNIRNLFINGDGITFEVGYYYDTYKGGTPNLKIYNQACKPLEIHGIKYIGGQ